MKRADRDHRRGLSLQVSFRRFRYENPSSVNELHLYEIQSVL
jgi:hypothetical protein